jgi:uncharacterized membrane protein YesL
MGLFDNAYQHKGVLKTPHEKKGFFKFWEVYGRHMWKLLEVNLLYLLFCLPVITIGPATAAMTKVCRNYSQERNVFLLADFWDSFKKNLKQGLVMSVIDIIFICGFIVGVPTYYAWAQANPMIYVPFFISLMCMLTFIMMHFYIYIMISSTNLKMWQILKNSFYLVALDLKASLWTLLVYFVVVFTCYAFMPASLFVIIFWPFSFLCFVSCFNCYPVVRKHVIQPYYDKRGEQNPEFEYMNGTKEEQLFEDRAAEEKPVKEEKRSKKKKKIS